MDLTEIRNAVLLKMPDYGVDEVDDAINFVHRNYIQPNARVGRTIEYTVNASDVSLSDIANDIYKIDCVFAHNGLIPILNARDAEGYGIRRDGSKVYFQGISNGTKLLIRYYAKLDKLSANNPEPEISEDWHDLYWLGAIYVLDPNQYYLFRDRINDFKRDAIMKDRPDGWKVKPKPWLL